MPKASVVALLAAGPLLLAAPNLALAQTAAKAPATDAPTPSAAPKAQKDTPLPKAAPAKAPAKTNAADSKATDKHDAAASDAKAPTTEPSAASNDASSSATAADATTAPSDATDSTSAVDATAQPQRPTLPTLPRGAGEPNPNPVTGPMLPAGLAPAAEPAPAAATTATAADKEAKGEDTVFAEDWWSHARPILELHGYFRTRAEMFHNFSLGRLSSPDQALWTMPADNRYTTGSGNAYGPALCTPGESDEVPGDSGAAIDARYACKNKNNSGANLRFRINPELHISDNLRIISQIDLLDNLVLGSTPAGYTNQPAANGGYAVVQRNGYAPMSFFDSTTIPPTAGVNSYTNSIAVKRVWGEFSTPLGQLRFGRMPDHFGLGMYHNSGDGYDADYQLTIDRIMFISSVKPLDLYFAGAWDFPSSGPTNQSLQDLQAQPYNVANSVNVRQLSLMLMRQKSPQLQKLSLSRGNLVVNGGAYLQYRWQDLAADNPGACSNPGVINPPVGGATLQNPNNGTGASLGCPSWGVSNALVRRGARAFTPDLWLQVLYKKFRFEAEAVTVQGSIDNVDNTTYQFGNNAAGTNWKLRSYGIATEFQQRLLEDRLDLSLYWGWASGDPNAAQLDGSMGLQPGNSGLQNAEGSNKFTEFRFNPAYRIDLILNRNILTRVQGTYYLRPAIGYDFMRKTNGQRLGGNLAGIWTRASEYVQAPGHQRDLGSKSTPRFTFSRRMVPSTTSPVPGRLLHNAAIWSVVPHGWAWIPCRHRGQLNPWNCSVLPATIRQLGPVHGPDPTLVYGHILLRVGGHGGPPLLALYVLGGHGGPPLRSRWVDGHGNMQVRPYGFVWFGTGTPLGLVNTAASGVGLVVNGFGRCPNRGQTRMFARNHRPLRTWRTPFACGYRLLRGYWTMLACDYRVLCG